jgi:hypothetical protein
LPFDVNLQRCQRYYQLIAQGISAAIRNAFAYNSTQAAAIFSLPNPMRATPSIDQTSGASYYRFQANATNYAFSSFTFDFGTGNQIFGIRTTSITGLTGGHSGNFQATNASSYFATKQTQITKQFRNGLKRVVLLLIMEVESNGLYRQRNR